MVEFFGGRRAPENVWIGVTAENQARANERIPILLSIPAAVRFVSVEPMLEYVNIEKYLLSERDKMGFETQYIESPGGLKTDKLDWVIVGPETGPGARPCDDAWIDGEPHAYAPFGLAEQCAEWGCAFFDKRKNWTRREWPK
jgi:protein gp37